MVVLGSLGAKHREKLLPEFRDKDLSFEKLKQKSHPERRAFAHNSAVISIMK